MSDKYYHYLNIFINILILNKYMVSEKESIDLLIKSCLYNNSLGFTKSIKKFINNKKCIIEVNFNITHYEYDEESKEFINILENEKDE
jgi:hypothetical protein